MTDFFTAPDSTTVFGGINNSPVEGHFTETSGPSSATFVSRYWNRLYDFVEKHSWAMNSLNAGKDTHSHITEPIIHEVFREYAYGFLMHYKLYIPGALKGYTGGGSPPSNAVSKAQSLKKDAEVYYHRILNKCNEVVWTNLSDGPNTYRYDTRPGYAERARNAEALKKSYNEWGGWLSELETGVEELKTLIANANYVPPPPQPPRYTPPPPPVVEIPIPQKVLVTEKPILEAPIPESALVFRNPNSPRLNMQFNLRNYDASFTPANEAERADLEVKFNSLLDDNRSFNADAVVSTMRGHINEIKRRREGKKPAYIMEVSVTGEAHEPAINAPGVTRTYKTQVPVPLPQVASAPILAKAFVMASPSSPAMAFTASQKEIIFQYVIRDPTTKAIETGIVSVPKSSLPGGNITPARSVADVLYSPSLTPTEIAAFTDAIDYKSLLATTRISSNFFRYLAPEVLKTKTVPDPSLPNLGNYMYPVYYQPYANMKFFEDQDEFMEFLSVNPADSFVLARASTDLSTWAKADAFYLGLDFDLDPEYTITSSSALLTSTIMNTLCKQLWSTGGGYADGVVRPYPNLTESFQILFKKANEGSLYNSYQVASVAVRLVW